MATYNKQTLAAQAKELGFVRDTLEKVVRLTDILKFMESDPLLGTSLALKGGTAINLTVFNLPRLSVDIDLDYAHNIIPRDLGGAAPRRNLCY
jgi:predicted nucleotidyltransferase component of viral defense system